MKFYLALASIMFSSASAELSLRSAMDWLSANDAQVEVYDARIVVGGLQDVISDAEANQVATHAKAAYNDVFRASSTGQKLNDIETTAAANIPSDSFWWTGECRFCSNNMKIAEEEAAFINARVEFTESMGIFASSEGHATTNLHMKFEEDLCDRLRMSGIPNFAKAKDCSFSFLAKPGMTEQVPVEKTYSSGGSLAQAELILAGLKNGINSEDIKFLNEVVVKAHNQAFAKFGLTLGSFQALADVAVGGFQGWLQQCSPCCYDDEPLCPDDAVQNTVTVIVGNAMPLPTTSLLSAEFKPVDAEISNQAFDTLICTHLRNSGNPSFEDVHTCSFNFVYTEVGKDSTALQG